MASPNIVNVANIYGRTTYLTPSVNTNVVLLTNAASSGKILKLNTILASNVDGTNSINATVSLYTNGAVAQGSAPSGGTAFPLIFTVSVPPGAALSLLDKSIYLDENMSIVVTSGTASKINYTISYDEIS
jgi:hypothetical protein